MPGNYFIKISNCLRNKFFWTFKNFTMAFFKTWIKISKKKKNFLDFYKFQSSWHFPLSTSLDRWKEIESWKIKLSEHDFYPMARFKYCLISKVSEKSAIKMHIRIDATFLLLLLLFYMIGTFQYELRLLRCTRARREKDQWHKKAEGTPLRQAHWANKKVFMQQIRWHRVAKEPNNQVKAHRLGWSSFLSLSRPFSEEDGKRRKWKSRKKII